MNSHTNSHAHGNLAENRRSILSSLLIIVFLLAGLSISGCTGFAGTPAASTKTNTSPTGSSGSLAASATSLAFGNVTTGSSSSQVLTLTNTGTASVTISQATITGAGFSVLGAMSSVIAAGQN